jgi:hypothetical protein
MAIFLLFPFFFLLFSWTFMCPYLFSVAMSLL